MTDEAMSPLRRRMGRRPGSDIRCPNGRSQLGFRDGRGGDAGGAADIFQIRNRPLGDGHQAGRRRPRVARVCLLKNFPSPGSRASLVASASCACSST
jgi:hypothetical protein